MDCRPQKANLSGPGRTDAYANSAVVKTVCGALLRRPGWVRFSSIPASLWPQTVF